MNADELEGLHERADELEELHERAGKLLQRLKQIAYSDFSADQCRAKARYALAQWNAAAARSMSS